MSNFASGQQCQPKLCLYFRVCILQKFYDVVDLFQRILRASLHPVDTAFRFANATRAKPAMDFALVAAVKQGEIRVHRSCSAERSCKRSARIDRSQIETEFDHGT